MPTGSGAESYGREVDFGFTHLSPSFRRFLAREAKRLCDRWALFFSDVESAAWWRIALCAAGLDYARTGAWIKVGATPQFTGDRPAAGFEAITICHPRGRKRWNGGGKHGVWSSPIISDRGATSVEPRIHTTQKPEDLIIALFNDFTDPGGIVYDFTAGGCTGAIAAIRANGGHRFWIGCEMDPEVETDECSTCGKAKKARVHRAGHTFEAKRARVWINRAVARINAELDGSTYHAAAAGQRPLFAGLT